MKDEGSFNRVLRRLGKVKNKAHGDLKKRVQELESKLSEATELITEANDLFEDAYNGIYEIDSFTAQPYRVWLEANKKDLK